MYNIDSIMRKKQGFTLIEMMIVAVILGLLASLIIPNYIYAQKISSLRGASLEIEQLNRLAQSFAQAGAKISGTSEPAVFGVYIDKTNKTAGIFRTKQSYISGFIAEQNFSGIDTIATGYSSTAPRKIFDFDNDTYLSNYSYQIPDYVDINSIDVDGAEVDSVAILYYQPFGQVAIDDGDTSNGFAGYSSLNMQMSYGGQSKGIRINAKSGLIEKY